MPTRLATSRYFVCDRTNLFNQLRLIPNCKTSSLEPYLNESLERNNAYRGNLGDGSNWHLHAKTHSGPFPSWAGDIVNSIEKGDFPTSLSGEYDLNLNDGLVRQEWAKIIDSANRNTAGAEGFSQSPRSKADKIRQKDISQSSGQPIVATPVDTSKGEECQVDRPSSYRIDETQQSPSLIGNRNLL